MKDSDSLNSRLDSPPETPDKPAPEDCSPTKVGDDTVIDVSGETLELSVPENAGEGRFRELFCYRNVFNLIPRALTNPGKLKTLKFFSNEINLFSEDIGNLVGLECLQLKVSSPKLSDLPLHKLKSLKELELCKVQPRLSACPIMSEIAGITCLTKLSVCHFSIRYLPPEIGCLKKLKYLDLSFNKIKRLPSEIGHLMALISLKATNNKLIELPSSMSSLQRLENLDLSHNRLTSLASLELTTMSVLQNLNLQVSEVAFWLNACISYCQKSYNKLLIICPIPSWICCNLEGNGSGSDIDEFVSSIVEMDVIDADIEDHCGNDCFKGSSSSLSGLSSSSSLSNRCISRKLGKTWKRRSDYQQKARQERLNNSRMWKVENHAEELGPNAEEECKYEKLTDDASENIGEYASESIAEGDSDFLCIEDTEKEVLSKESQCGNLNHADEGIPSQRKESKIESCSHDIDAATLVSSSDLVGKLDEGCSSDVSKSNMSSKRHSDEVLNNPKPCKSQRPSLNHVNMSEKYSATSFCSIEDRLVDGFYDAGRDRPFMPLKAYEKTLHLDSREVILVDRRRDEELDAILLSARALVSRLKQVIATTRGAGQVASDNLQIACLLSLFVSDHFGGSDRAAMIEKTRKSVSGSNYRKPFTCTCSTGNRKNLTATIESVSDTVEDVIFSDICEKSLRSIKRKRNSIVVPIGTLQFGVCRHRALLFKYLCDTMEPPIPCELVRGYLDFMPHAWNVILIKRDDSWIRMLVDACHPHDIREETEPEFFCRYIPLSHVNISLTTESDQSLGSVFPSLSESDEVEQAASSTLRRCRVGSVESVAKVRTVDVCGTLTDEIKKFEYNCLGEVRILRAMKHSCIVECYGHQISSKWVLSDDGNPHRRVMHSAILLEYIKGGSLKKYIEELSVSGEKHVSADLIVCIARDVACALVELHSKHIIHRDIKSENILIDVDHKRADKTPIVKLCDFDRAVPLRSFLHTCCIGHLGVPPPDTCVGTPRWMAPEVLHTMHERKIYGLEVDIWSYGCLLYELLTLQIPYAGIPEPRIHDLLQMGERPPLTEELDALGSLDESALDQSGDEIQRPEARIETLKFLIDLFRKCTEKNPADRPTAQNVYERLLDQMDVKTT